MKGVREYLDLYRGGQAPEEVLRELCERIEEENHEGIWIYRSPWAEIEEQLSSADRDGALFGVPFVIKDNIDWAGRPTTAACPAYEYVPAESAPVVARLLAAGAICMGKTNLDQFATGLVGTRTPYGPPKNPFDARYLPGGSSCGSAVAVARGYAAFALGTDTAGSGRVPAAFNELVGLKPTRGFLSTRGVVPACRSLDCVSIFAKDCADAESVLRVAAVYDEHDAWSRRAPERWPRFGKQFRFGVPPVDELEFFGWDGAAILFEEAAKVFESIGGERVDVRLDRFLEAARLLYEGPWVTERYVAIEDFLEKHPDEIWPVTREIIAGGAKPSAADAFRAQYSVAECRQAADRVMDTIEFILAPTAPRNFTLEEVEAEPIQRNSQLGTYTNFMNLLDLSALALPAGRYEGKLPWGVTIFAPAGTDRALLEVGARYEAAREGREPVSLPADWDEIELVVCGAHLEGLALNWQLTERGGRIVARTHSAPCYRMFVIEAGDGMPERPAMMRDEENGAALEVEVWSLTREFFGDFVAAIPGPLGIGKVLLEDGREVPGFIAEPRAAEGAREITELGGWRAYLAGK